MDSSDPDTTEYSTQGEEEKKEEPPVVEEEEEKEELEEQPIKKKKLDCMPYFLIVLIDIVIPLMLVLSAISCMSIMGMVFVILLYLHVVIANLTTKSYGALKSCLSIDFVVNLIVFVFAILNYQIDFHDNEVVSYLGLNFDNIITNKPTFTLVTSLIALICQVVSLIVIGKTPLNRFVEIRQNYFASATFQFSLQVLWAICNAFNAASNSSYLYLPILLYFLVSNICQSVNGKVGFSSFLLYLILFYSLLFALFELFIVSEIGERLDNQYNISGAIAYVYIAPDSTKAINVVAAVLFAYISIQQISAPGLKVGEQKPIPKAIKQLNDVLVIAAFALVMLYAIFYPSYMSVIWMLIPFMATFATIDKLRRFFLPLLTIIFTISFVIIFVTSVELFGVPTINGRDNNVKFMQLFGLYRYPRDFTFCCCGFYLICILGICGSITNADEKLIEKNNEDEENKEEVIDPKLERERKLQEAREKMKRRKLNNNNSDSMFEEEEEKNEEEEQNEEKEKKSKFNFKEFKEKAKKVIKKIGYVLHVFIASVAICAMIVVGIVTGFYKDRFAYHVLAAIFIIIVLLGLYKKCIFHFVKVIVALMMMFATFYKTTFNEECFNNLDECLFYGKWSDSISYDQMIKTGLIAPINMDLITFVWPLIVILILSTYLSKDKASIDMSSKLPIPVKRCLYFIVAVLHFLYMFLFDTNIFSIIFMLVALSMITSQYLKKTKLLSLSLCFSCIAVSIQLCLMLLTHFDGPRNFLGSVIISSILKMDIYEPSLEIGILSVILFLSTISFYTENPDQKSKEHFILDNIIYELRVIFDLFYFYFCWIFIFLFSIVNDNPSFIKFFIMLFFALGRVSAPIFYKIRIPFLIFNIAYAVIQYIFHIFGLDDESDRNYGIYSYIGLFFCSPGKPTKAQRNMSLMYQIIVMLIGIINIKPYKRKVTNVKFESYLIVRIYNAICSMLHHWLPLIVQVSLCTSTIFNPSIFGWLSYIVMIIVVFKPTILNTSSGVVTLLFNICFIAQYLLYLGFPEAIFNTNFNVMDYVTTDNEETRTTIQNWIRWAGVYDVKQSALSTNCISAFVFTFYLTWHNTFVDYDHRYEQLPEILKYLIRVFVTYVFEIVTSIILIITIDMKTVDGFLSFVLTGVLLICSIFYDYPKIKSLLIMSISSICVIGLRLLSRLPVFTQEGIASWIQRAFGLPFQGDSRSEIQVIVIYSLERLCIHILNSDIYKECLEEQTKHMAYRYLRSRQLYIIEKLDKENIESKRETEIKQIKSMATNNLDSFSEALGNSENMLILKSEHMNITNENDKEIHWYDFIIDFIPSLIDKIISLLAISLPVNSESGINFLTLKSLTIIMKKISRFYKIGKLYIPTPEEKGFINSLPPSFALHYQSLAEACDYLLINDTNRMCLLIRYILLFIRKISLPLLTLILLIYIYLRPYIFSLIVLIIFLCIILPLDLKGIPKLYITFLSFVLFILMLRAICNVDLLEEQIRIANNSVNIQQMMISVISLFGIDPSQSSVPEILLFLATVFFVCDQLAYTQIYPSNYYYEKYKEILPKFPQEYCYGLFKNPSEALELNYPQPNIIQQIKEIISRPGLIKINHHIYILIIDVISFLVLFFSWSSWSYNEQSSGSQGFQINILFIFMLIIHVIFSFFCYYCSISCSYFILFILNLIWLVYTYCITFFYLPTCNRDNHSSLQFFFFLRFFAHLIICHQCFIGRKNISYKYPNFRKQWLSILVLNKFIHAFPYAFEIQTILLWMSKKTKVSLSDFFVVRDITQQLEILIAKQSNPYKEKEPKPKKRILISIIIFVIAIIIIFGILLILSSSSSSTIFNPPLSAKLELGLSSIGTLYESQGIISHITTNEHQSIIDSGLSSLYDLVYSGDSCYIIDYPLVSYINYQPIGTELQNINEILSSTAEIIPFFKYTFYFNKPTTISSVQNVIYQTYSTNPLTMKEKETLLEILNTNQSNDPLFNYQIPLIIMIPQAEEIYHINDLILSMNLYKENNIWNMNVSTNDLAVSCLRTNNYRMIMWSQQVTPDSLLGSASTSLIIYLVIVVILGVLIRNVVLGFMDSLWVDRMKEPQKLYRMIIAIEAFRSANDEDKEYIVTEKLLDTLRSKENCLEITEQTKD